MKFSKNLIGLTLGFLAMGLLAALFYGFFILVISKPVIATVIVLIVFALISTIEEV